MFISNIDKAKVLIEALPYIQKYYGKTIVVKYGGNAMENEGLKDAVISDLVLLRLVGINVVMVHGGGPEITSMFDKLGIETQFINGLRYTGEEAIEVVQMVLAGKTNKDLVNKITSIGGSAVGLSGIDGGMIKAKKLDDGKNDYGAVGEITEVNTKIITDNIGRRFYSGHRDGGRRCGRRKRRVQHQFRHGGSQNCHCARCGKADSSDQHARSYA